VQVFQVRKKDTGRIYAMKVMRKEKILEKEHGDYIRAEREILKTVIHPYIVALRFSFQVPLLAALVELRGGGGDLHMAGCPQRQSYRGDAAFHHKRVVLCMMSPGEVCRIKPVAGHGDCEHPFLCLWICERSSESYLFLLFCTGL